MVRRRPPRKVTWFEPVAPRLAPNAVIASTFEVDRRFRCTMRAIVASSIPTRRSGRNWRNGAPAAMRSISWPH
jgi:hypothetical protein